MFDTMFLLGAAIMLIVFVSGLLMGLAANRGSNSTSSGNLETSLDRQTGIILQLDLPKRIHVPADIVLHAIAGQLTRNNMLHGDREEHEESLRESARLLAQKYKELHQELEEMRKYDIRNLKLYCPRCKEYLEPIIADDGRLLCPRCKIPLAQITGDQLEILMTSVKA